MKKATLIIWVLIFGVIALLIFQNQAFFLSNQSLQVNLGVTDPYHTPELPIGILVLLFFLTGVVIAYLFSLSARFKARRTIKKLNTTIASHNDEVAGLRREIDSIKGIETPEDTNDTQKLASDGLAGDQTVATGTFSIDSKADDATEKSEEKNT
ncbi:MAG: LapA family protein [Deltaproteobacteria bacterium]|nr:LapA family protein [Deltaproteobacteria bacterium]